MRDATVSKRMSCSDLRKRSSRSHGSGHSNCSLLRNSKRIRYGHHASTREERQIAHVLPSHHPNSDDTIVHLTWSGRHLPGPPSPPPRPATDAVQSLSPSVLLTMKSQVTRQVAAATVPIRVTCRYTVRGPPHGPFNARRQRSGLYFFSFFTKR